jgi:hypothetical protein
MTVVEEFHHLDPRGRLALPALLSPSSFEPVAPWENVGPGLASEIRDKDNERALDCDGSGFKLDNQPLSVTSFQLKVLEA